MNTELTKPMLAKFYLERKQAVFYPAYIQPKYNGMRCLFNSDIGFWSRYQNIVSSLITKHLEFDTHGHIFDGELVMPQGFTFQQTMSFAKSFDQFYTPKLLYIIFDVIDTTSYFWRQKTLENLFSSLEMPPNVRLAETIRVNSEAHLEQLHYGFLNQGYEGSIIRRRDGNYQADRRSDYLLKYKRTIYKEFEIVGYKAAVGKDAGTAVFVCVTPDKMQIFAARPMGSLELRTEMYKQGESYIGKFLLIKFHEYSDNGIPIPPIGVRIQP